MNKFKLYPMPIIQTPYGRKKLVYADSTASAQKEMNIDNYMIKNIYPIYANTHSNAYMGRTLSKNIQESKEYIAKEVNANDTDVVIFTGEGTTGAINQFIHSMKLKVPTKQKTVVFISKLEHFSNHLPWTELPVLVKYISFDCDGKIKLDELDNELLKYKSHNKVISMSSGSNVTGVIQDVEKICKIVHKYKKITVCFDYACTSPYVNIDMANNNIDAIFISPHKMLGGAGVPGILVANTKIFKNNKPYCPGGSTVKYGDEYTHEYSKNISVRENGGTPNVLGQIQAKFVFELRNELLPYIIKRDNEILKYVDNKLKKLENIVILNPKNTIDRLPIYSIVFPNIHYNLVVVLLNDLFGIQSRGGISCCGLIAPYLLDIDKNKLHKIHNQIHNNNGVSKQYGWVRISFNYTMNKKTIIYILSAIKYVANNGCDYIKSYKYDKHTNLWDFVKQ
jgi:selenocysteine lyase/cysteine desulfurase